jgi:two-component system osmolarity sensor histidine kinase EnvZ
LPKIASPRAGRWFDSLFSHIFLTQLVVGALMSIVFLLLLSNEQASISAHTIAPLWIQALQPARQRLAASDDAALPFTAEVTASISMIAGPPPADANMMPWVPRYRALLAQLQDLGLPVRRLAVSGESDGTTTWLELETAPGQTRWVGLQGGLGGAEMRSKGTLWLATTMVVFILAAAWLSRRVARPLLDLQAGVIAFAATGRPPESPAASAAASAAEADAAIGGPAARGPANRGPSEVRQLAAQFAKFAVERARQDEAREVMLAAISHDLRSPLSRIRVAAELLPDLPAIENRRNSIVRNAQLADKLVGSFLDLARASAEPFEEKIDLRAYTLELFGSGDHDDVMLNVSAPDALWLYSASSIALERLFSNLLDNALKYGQPPFEVHLWRDGDAAVLTVRDHGAGIAPEQMPRLRQAFFRGAQDRGQPGTGLGLSIVERTVSRLGGDMRLLDAGPGLAVSIRLPLAAN